jgi:cytochrome P450
LLLNTTLDIIGHAALGYELNSLSTSSVFADCYDTVFSASLLGNLITVIHHFVPIRWALPIKVNRDFVNANATIRRLLREHIRRRKHEISINKEGVVGEKHDLLTLMIKEKVDVVDPWSEDEILGHVSTYPR